MLQFIDQISRLKLSQHVASFPVVSLQPWELSYLFFAFLLSSSQLCPGFLCSPGHHRIHMTPMFQQDTGLWKGTSIKNLDGKSPGISVGHPHRTLWGPSTMLRNAGVTGHSCIKTDSEQGKSGCNSERPQSPWEGLAWGREGGYLGTQDMLSEDRKRTVWSLPVDTSSLEYERLQLGVGFRVLTLLTTVVYCCTSGAFLPASFHHAFYDVFAVVTYGYPEQLAQT